MKTNLLDNKYLGKLIPLLIAGAYVALIVFGINIFRKTFIEWYWLIFPIILAPIIFYPLLKNFFFKPNAKYHPDKIFIFIYVAPFAYYLFLAINFYTADTKNQITKTFKIEEKGEMYSKNKTNRTPYIIVHFESLRKQLIISKNDQQLLVNASQIKLNYSKGLFGFYVVENYELF